MSLSSMRGLRTPDVKKIACRYCSNARKGGIAQGRCTVYPDGKPDGVIFYNKPCPKYKKGEDLLPYEIEI